MGQRSAERILCAAVGGGVSMGDAAAGCFAGTCCRLLRGGRAARWAVPAGDGKEGLKIAVGCARANCGGLRRRSARRGARGNRQKVAGVLDFPSHPERDGPALGRARFVCGDWRRRFDGGRRRLFCGGRAAGCFAGDALARWAVPAGDGKEGLKIAVGCARANCGVLRHRFAHRGGWGRHTREFASLCTRAHKMDVGCIR